jgi:FixJ family two-component response regulator
MEPKTGPLRIVDPGESKRLLDTVRRATVRSERARARALERYNRELARANEPRRAAVQACFDAHLPRKDIAEAAGVTVARLYQVLDPSDTP